MADSPGRRRSRRDSLDASSQHQSSSSGTAAARSPPGSKERKRGTAKANNSNVRWLLTRKTWRYMADAGRRLIPESIAAAKMASSVAHHQQQSENIPIELIEQNFQEICSKETKFLPVPKRKYSCPGSWLGLPSIRVKPPRRIGGSCRIKPSWLDEAERRSRGSNSSFGGVPSSPVINSGRLDFNKVKREWLLTDHHHRSSATTLDSSGGGGGGSASSSPGVEQERLSREEAETRELEEMLERLLIMQESQSAASTITSTSSNPTTTRSTSGDHSVPGCGLAKEPSSSTTSSLDCKKLFEKLNQLLNQLMSDSRRDEASGKSAAAAIAATSTYSGRRTTTNYPASATSSTMTSFDSTGGVSRRAKPYHSDSGHQMLLDTLRRQFGKSPNCDHMMQDILTDRKKLSDLYFAVRRVRNFRGPRSTGVWTSPSTRFLTSPSGTSSTGGSRSRLGKSGGDDARDGREVTSPPPLIAVQGPSIERGTTHQGTQTDPVSRETLDHCLQEHVKEHQQQLSPKEQQQQQHQHHKSGRRRSSLEDDVSPSVSDTIKRYLRMARKKSVDGDKADRFKRVNYDRNLRNIKAKGEISKPGDDDGNSKGCQTQANWMIGYREMGSMQPGEALQLLLLSDDAETTTSPISRDASSRSSIDAGLGSEEPTTPKHHQSFLSHFLHGGNAMQKSKSSSSVVHHSSRLVAKKIFKSRSKSSSRAVNVVCAWTPQGKCTWAGTSGRRVTLQDTPLRQLSDIERKILSVVAVAKLQALNLGVQIRPPAESLSGGSSSSKPKRRAYLLKRKALTTSLFDNKGKEDKDKDAIGTGLVFGLPLAQCLENDRMSRVGSTGSGEMGYDSALGHASRLGSRASFTSLFESTTSTSAKTDEGGSWESLPSKTTGTTTGSAALTGSDSGVLLELGDGHLSDFEVVPNIVRQCIKHLELTGLHMLGIFRVSPSKKRVRQLREDWDCGRETKIGADQCPHDVAALLKEYFRDLPDALLCRDLYQAFVHTQKIRNRRLQHEALQHLVQLLPTPNRETLYALLNFLSEVAANSEDRGELIGNKMDKTNLATVFAPNILHCVKAGHARTELSAERAEERIDVINVVRALLEHVSTLFIVPAALVDELYLHMMDSHPAELDAVLSRRADEQCQDDPELCCSETENYSVDETSSPTSPTSPTALTAPATAVSSSSGTSSTSQRRLYSRQECLHEAGGTGGDIVSPRQPRRSNKRPSGRRKDGLVVGDSSTGRSNSIDSVSSLEDHPTPTLADSRKSKSGSVITASLTIPMTGALTLNLDDPDIPYIEDTTNNVVKSASPNAPPRRQRQRATSGDDPASPTKYSGGSDSAVGSSSNTVEQAPSSPSWAMSSCSPPASPDSVVSPRQQNPEQQQASLQRVSFTTSSELKQIQRSSMLDAYHQRPQPSAHKPQQASLGSSYMSGGATSTRTPAYTPSITNIGGAVMRCKTEDIERMMSLNCGELPSSSSRSSINSSSIKPSSSTSNVLDHKKYTKRRYTDSRHQTRHIPDAETLSKTSSSHLPSMSFMGSRLSSVLHPHSQKSGSGSGSASSHHSGGSRLSVTTGGSSTSTSTSTTTQPTTWKRRELISSASKGPIF
ncbi:hypothetical protein TKK_0019215 [Trichogramma kaykai]|uniref:Rho-GAP domain-containing protein n=1 Tax=Trichogramma kaykai TaxID=54128 RepID=A0ABD2VTW2_9HYME